METLSNGRLRLAISPDAATVIVEDVPHGCVWRLDTSRRGYQRGRGDQQVRPFPQGRVHRIAEAIVSEHRVDAGVVRYSWSLEDDHVRVELTCDREAAESVSLPGPFEPTHGSTRIAVPIYQGLLIDGRGGNWEANLGHHGHFGFTMAMAAVIGDRGALLATHDSPTNWKGRFGQADGRPFVTFEHQRCAVEGFVDAVVRLYPMDRDVKSICHRYRQRLIERGQFRSWEEKIAVKPAIAKLFGSLFAFIGYNATTQVDYATSARRLRDGGFDRVFYYPVGFCHYSKDFRMGGDEPIALNADQIAALKAAGGRVSPWGWVMEALDDGTPQRRSVYRRDHTGQFVPNWKIDQYQWYETCTPYQMEFLRQQLAGEMAGMDWMHFDVSAMRPGVWCCNTEHALHANRPMGRREDLAWVQRLFSHATVGNRVVSSEGFGDHYAPYYDVGTTKAMPADPAEHENAAIVVPMTSLVLHDSCLHDWWEVHNYNANPGFGPGPIPHDLALGGSGRPRLKAAIDALHGYPPNVFPFGRQYAWIDIEKRTTYSFVVQIDDEPVRAALAAALPVAKLHRRIGRHAMTDFQLLSDDGRVQTTTFADGTRVVANFGNQPAEIDGWGRLEGESWREARP